MPLKDPKQNKNQPSPELANGQMYRDDRPLSYIADFFEIGCSNFKITSASPGVARGFSLTDGTRKNPPSIDYAA